MPGEHPGKLHHVEKLHPKFAKLTNKNSKKKGLCGAKNKSITIASPGDVGDEENSPVAEVDELEVIEKEPVNPNSSHNAIFSPPGLHKGPIFGELEDEETCSLFRKELTSSPPLSSGARKGDVIRQTGPAEPPPTLSQIKIEDGFMRYHDVFIYCFLMPVSGKSKSDTHSFVNQYLHHDAKHRHVKIVEGKYGVRVKMDDETCMFKGKPHQKIYVLSRTSESLKNSISHLHSSVKEMDSAVTDYDGPNRHGAAFQHHEDRGINSNLKKWATSSGLSKLIFWFRHTHNLPVKAIDTECDSQVIFSQEEVHISPAYRKALIERILAQLQLHSSSVSICSSSSSFGKAHKAKKNVEGRLQRIRNRLLHPLGGKKSGGGSSYSSSSTSTSTSTSSITGAGSKSVKPAGDSSSPSKSSSSSSSSEGEEDAVEESTDDTVVDDFVQSEKEADQMTSNMMDMDMDMDYSRKNEEELKKSLGKILSHKGEVFVTKKGEILMSHERKETPKAKSTVQDFLQSNADTLKGDSMGKVTMDLRRNSNSAKQVSNNNREACLSSSFSLEHKCSSASTVLSEFITKTSVRWLKTDKSDTPTLTSTPTTTWSWEFEEKSKMADEKEENILSEIVRIVENTIEREQHDHAVKLTKHIMKLKKKPRRMRRCSSSRLEALMKMI